MKTRIGTTWFMIAAAALLVATTLSPAMEPQTSVPAEDAEAEAGVHVRWMSWERDTFELAAALKRPVLLYVRRVDCRLCAQMERDIFDDPEVVKLIAEQVVPIAVDADLRPDVAARYVIAAVPTVSYLLPNGAPMYRIETASSLQRVGAYMASPEPFRQYLNLAVRYMKQHPQQLVEKAREVATLEAKVRDLSPGPPPLDRIASLGQQIRDHIDYTHGGFGRKWKTIEDAPYRLFRTLSVEPSGAALVKATLTTAQRMLASDIHDDVEGGFHHFATQRDWSVPALEKRLDVNSRALRLLVAASLMAPDDADLRAGVASTADFLLNSLALDDGGFALAQTGTLGPDDPGTYFTSSGAERETRRPPPIRKRFISEYNAGAAIALLEAGALLGRDDLEQVGLHTVDVLVALTYRDGRGFGRSVTRDGGVKVDGLLIDQVSGLEALLAAYQARGATSDLLRAREVAGFCRANLRHAAGHFLDRPDDLAAVGKMKRGLVDSAANGRLAVALWKLSTLTGEASLRTDAKAIVGALAGAVGRMTERDASYMEALLALRDPPVMTVVAGPATAPAAVALRRVARLGARAGSVLLPVGVDITSGAVNVPDGWQEQEGSAWLCWGAQCSGPWREPADLRSALANARDVRIDPGSAGQ